MTSAYLQQKEMVSCFLFMPSWHRPHAAPSTRGLPPVPPITDSWPLVHVPVHQAASMVDVGAWMERGCAHRRMGEVKWV